MEPANLNPPPPDDAQLEAWYRANLSAPPLKDDGFSQRVLTALPSSEKSSDNKRRLYCIGGGVIGATVALIGLANSAGLPADLPAFRPDLADSLAQLANPAFALALAVTLLSLWVVFRRPSRRLRPQF